MKKTTKLEQFTAMKAFFEAEGKTEFAEFIAHEIELLEKRSSAERKPTAAQLANDSLGEAILAAMADRQARTITDMIKTFPCCAEMSTQKVSPIVNKLVSAGKLIKSTEHRRTLFTIVEGV